MVQEQSEVSSTESCGSGGGARKRTSSEEPCTSAIKQHKLSPGDNVSSSTGSSSLKLAKTVPTSPPLQLKPDPVPVAGPSNSNSSTTTKPKGPPPNLDQWLQTFNSWSSSERIAALDSLVTSKFCEVAQMRHLLGLIEPLMQRDFISLLPKELSLYVLSFLEPEHLLRAAQACRYWRILCEDNLLWREKCREEGLLEGTEAFSTVFRRRHATYSYPSRVQKQPKSEEYAWSDDDRFMSPTSPAYSPPPSDSPNYSVPNPDLETLSSNDDEPTSPENYAKNEEEYSYSPKLSPRYEVVMEEGDYTIDDDGFYSYSPKKVDSDGENLAGGRAGKIKDGKEQNEEEQTFQVSDYKLAYLRYKSIEHNWRYGELNHGEGADGGSALGGNVNNVNNSIANQENGDQQQEEQAANNTNRAGNSSSSNSACQANATTSSSLPKNRFKPRKLKDVLYLKGHEDHVITCLQFNPLSNIIVSGSDDNTLKVWSSVTGRCLLTLTGHTGGVWSSQLSPDNVAISGSTDRSLRVWDALSGRCLHVLYGHTSTVRCMALHGKYVVSGSRDATLRAWNILTGACEHILVGHLAAVRCVQYNGTLCVSGAYDFLVKVWSVANETCLYTLDGHTNRVYSLQFDGVHIVSGSLDTSIRVWSAETGKLKHTLVGHQSLTSGMQLRGNILVSGNADSTVKVWDITTGQCLQTLSGTHKHQSAVTCLQFNSNFVITSSDDGTVKLWDLKTGEFIRNLVSLPSGGSGGVVWRIRASSTQLVCAVGSRNGTEETKLIVLNFETDDLFPGENEKKVCWTKPYADDDPVAPFRAKPPLTSTAASTSFFGHSVSKYPLGQTIKTASGSGSSRSLEKKEEKEDEEEYKDRTPNTAEITKAMNEAEEAKRQKRLADERIRTGVSSDPNAVPKMFTNPIPMPTVNPSILAAFKDEKSVMPPGSTIAIINHADGGSVKVITTPMAKASATTTSVLTSTSLSPVKGAAAVPSVPSPSKTSNNTTTSSSNPKKPSSTETTSSSTSSSSPSSSSNSPSDPISLVMNFLNDTHITAECREHLLKSIRVDSMPPPPPSSVSETTSTSTTATTVVKKEEDNLGAI